MSYFTASGFLFMESYRPTLFLNDSYPVSQVDNTHIPNTRGAEQPGVVYISAKMFVYIMPACFYTLLRQILFFSYAKIHENKEFQHGQFEGIQRHLVLILSGRDVRDRCVLLYHIDILKNAICNT